jgi:tetratricopeptide (TPR) repeat protein
LLIETPDSRVLANTTPRAIAKTILSQLFEQQIGNMRLYRILSDTYRKCQETFDGEAYGDMLWEALGTALEASRTGAKDLILIVDGVDEVSCGESALLERLRNATAHSRSTKMILLTSQLQSTNSSQDRIATVRITPELIFDDIAAVVRRVFQSSDAFNSMPQAQQESNVTRVAEASKGSFLWAKLASKQARDEETSNSQGLKKAIDSIVKKGTTIRDLVSRNLQSNLHKDGLKLIVWLATACRPLSVRELSALLSIQKDKDKILEEDLPNPYQLLKPVAALVFIQNNLVFLRHGKLRDCIVDIFNRGSILPEIKNRNLDLAQRLLLYTNHTVPDRREPTLESLEPQSRRSLMEKYPLLDFALRYWVDHVRTAMGCSTDREISAAAKELRAVIPTSINVPLFEMTVWETRATPVQVSLHDTQIRLYQLILTSSHPTTLQASLCQVLFYWKIHDNLPNVENVFYNTVKLCQELLSAEHRITMKIAQYYLEITTTHVTNSKTTIMLKRIEILRLLVECYKVQYGSTSDIFISTSTQLADHYHAIQEVHHAEEVLATLSSSTNEGTIQGVESGFPDDSLHIHLHGRKESMVAGTSLSLDEIEADAEATSTFDFESLLSQAQQHVQNGNHNAAELIYVEIWQRSSWEYRLHRTVEWGLMNTQAVLAYSNFLLNQKKDNQVAAILWGTWEEHEQTTSISEALVSQFVEIAKLMKSIGLCTVAMRVLKHCAQSISRQSSVYSEIQRFIHSTSQEIIQAASSPTSTVAESTLEEIVFSTATTQHFSTTATNSLISMYLSQRRFHDASKTMKLVLQGIWPALFAPLLEEVVLPSSNVECCVELAERLSTCYRARRRLAKEEYIRLRLYYALRHDRPTTDKLHERVRVALLRFYERTSRTDELISIHQEILTDYTKRYGQKHSTVLKELWILADLTRLCPVSVEYYAQIVEILNQGSTTCHPDAFEPLLIVLTELLRQGRYSDALRPCQTLLNTLQHPSTNPNIGDQAFAMLTYNRYVYCLRMTRADTSVIHDVTVQFRKACLSLFGTTASVTIQATTTLALICQDINPYKCEAISLYEELLQIQAPKVDIDYEGIQATLDALYEEQMTAVTSSTESVTSQQFHKVVTIQRQRLSTIRSTYGWAHQETLSQMESLVSLYSRRREYKAAYSLLEEATVEIISKETSAVKLSLAAQSIASSFIASGQVQRANNLTQEIYQQLVAKDSTVNSINIHVVSNHQSLLFLAQLEYGLQEREVVCFTVNEIYSSLLTEYLYFERFRTEIKAKSSSVQSMISTASRLHGLLLARHRQSNAVHLEEQLTNYFTSAERDRVDVTFAQGKVFISTLLQYFNSHSSRAFIRSVAIASYNRVTQLLASRDYQTACDLALASFKYIRAHNGFSSLPVVKLVFKLGLAISGRDIKPRGEASIREKTLTVSGTITKEALTNFEKLNVDLTQLDLMNLNRLIGLLDEQKDYHTLVRVLTSLWNAREARGTSQHEHVYTLALGRMLVITRYLTSDYVGAIRLAEDIVYNCARVHGPRQQSTVEMTVLLSQMYTSVAQGYQNQKEYRDLAYRYYKKAAMLHENALRSFVDPSYFISTSEEPSSLGSSDAASPSPGERQENGGKYVRQHLHLLKLAIERLGDWPKEYSEYECLNTNLFKAFENELKGVEGVEKWDLKKFGSGSAEASDDLIMPISQEGVSLRERLAIPV